MKIFVFLLLIGGVIFMFTQLPIITGRGVKEVREALEQTQEIQLSGPTLFISDLHLTEEPALDQQFNLDFSNVNNVVIVGDLTNGQKDFASFGANEEERFRTILEGIVPTAFSGSIFYTHALTHDPQGLETVQLSFTNFEFYHLGRYGKFSIDGTSVVAYHGDQLHGGMIGGGIAWLAKKAGQEVLLEKLGKKRFDIPKDTWVVNGHSHVPGIDKKAKVANSGSFVGAPFNKFIFRVHIGSGVLFDAGNVELQEYEGLNIKKLYPFSL